MPTITTVIDALRQEAGMSHAIVALQVAGLTHAESLRPPAQGGNCLNWVLGHLINVDGAMLALLGQQPVLPRESIACYARGSQPLVPGEALDLAQLLTAWEESGRRVDAGLATLTPARLAEPAPPGTSPRNDPSETIGSLLVTISWHQAYHIGQTALLRRLAGKPGAIK